jgi:hypothetical protein
MRLFIPMAVVVALVSGAVRAHAGPCSADIERLRKVAQSASPVLPQNLGIELHHRPMVKDVESAQNHAKAEVAAAFASAQEADA